MAELNARSRCALNSAHPSSRTTVINLNPVIRLVGSVTERLTTWLTVYDRRHLRNRCPACSWQHGNNNVTAAASYSAWRYRPAMPPSSCLVYAVNHASAASRVRLHISRSSVCVLRVSNHHRAGCCAMHHAGYAGNDKDDGSRATSHSIAILFRFSGIRPSSAQGLVNTTALSCCI